VLNVCNILKKHQTELLAEDRLGGYNDGGGGSGDNVYEQIRTNNQGLQL
jgi:hypothetical protein